MKLFTRRIIFIIYNLIKRQVNFYEKESLMKNGLLKVGHKSYGHFTLTINNYKGSEQPITIGNYTSIGPNVRIITGGIHPKDWVSLFPLRVSYALQGAYIDGMPSSNGPVNIGSDVWIGTGVTILSGVTISNGAIIYSNSVINKDVPAFAIIAGIPGKIVGYRFEPDVIEKLKKIEWWNWTEEKVIKSIPHLSNNDIIEFIKKYEFGF